MIAPPILCPTEPDAAAHQREPAHVRRSNSALHGRGSTSSERPSLHRTPEALRVNHVPRLPGELLSFPRR